MARTLLERLQEPTRFGPLEDAELEKLSKEVRSAFRLARRLGAGEAQEYYYRGLYEFVGKRMRDRDMDQVKL